MREGVPLARLAAAGVVLLLGAACAALFRQPEVRLEGVRLAGIGLRGGTLMARLHIENPNDFDLESRSLSYRLELQDPDSSSNWVALAQDTIRQRIAVAAGSAEVVEVPIEFSYGQLAPAVRTLLYHGTFDYRVSGRIEVARPISRSVPYRKTGQITLEGAR